MLYWPHSTPAALASTRLATAALEAERRALDQQTIDQVAPGEQQPESDHAYQAEGGDAGLAPAGRYRHATGWFSYTLLDPRQEAKSLRLSFSPLDAGRQFDLQVNGVTIAAVTLEQHPGAALYTRDFPIPAGSGSKLVLRLVARQGSIAGGLYGLRLMK
jgi:uncharacterized protein